MGKSKIKKILFYGLIIFVGLALTILFYFLLNNQTSAEPLSQKIMLILRPFVIGGVIAYIMKSTCNFFERIYKKRLLKSGKRSEKKAQSIASKLSVVTTYVIWIAAVGALIAIIINPLINSARNLISTLFVNVPLYAERAIEFIHDKLAGQPKLEEFFEAAINSVSNTFNLWVEEDLTLLVEQIGAGLIAGISDIIVFVKDVLIGLVISCLLLLNRKTLAEKSKIFIRCIFKDNASNAIISEFRYADKMFSGFLEGKIIGSTIVGIIYYIALLIMQVPYAPLIAVFCGVTNIIPIFGPFIGAVPSAIIILTEDPIKVIPFIIFICIVQFIDGYIIDPHIVGGSIKMSVFSVLFAVTLFGGLWGFAGLLVGVPVFAVIYDICKKIFLYILKKKDKEYLLEDFEKNVPSKRSRKQKKVAVAQGAAPCEAADNAEEGDLQSSDTASEQTDGNNDVGERDTDADEKIKK